MENLIIKVEGMMCSGCENRVQNALQQIEGIEKVIANHKKGTVTIKASKEIDTESIKEKIEDIGFKVK